MDKIEYLIKKSKQVRRDLLKLAIESNNGHIASAFSTVEIIVALYEEFLKEEDRFILSKGHACLSLYTILRYKGLNPKISIHPDIEREQGIECTTGSLGHGLPIGVGMAFAKKFKNEKGKVFVLIGDGECQEGTTWESLNLAKRFKLDNLVVIVDNNKLQALDTIKNIMWETDLKGKFEVFGCDVAEINGHNFEELINSFDANNIKINMPRVIIAHTIKGKGVSFMENVACWHSRIPEGKLLEQAYKELE